MGTIGTWWRRVARRIGDVQARLLLTVFYFVLLAPFALAVRLGADPLALKLGAGRGWRARQERPGSVMSRATQQS